MTLICLNEKIDLPNLCTLQKSALLLFFLNEAFAFKIDTKKNKEDLHVDNKKCLYTQFSFLCTLRIFLEFFYFFKRNQTACTHRCRESMCIHKPFQGWHCQVHWNCSDMYRCNRIKLQINYEGRVNESRGRQRLRKSQLNGVDEILKKKDVRSLKNKTSYICTE